MGHTGFFHALGRPHPAGAGDLRTQSFLRAGGAASSKRFDGGERSDCIHHKNPLEGETGFAMTSSLDFEVTHRFCTCVCVRPSLPVRRRSNWTFCRSQNQVERLPNFLQIEKSSDAACYPLKKAGRVPSGPL